jgi:dTDP-4-dehydrorhamnose 3,5-epimerase
MIFRPTSVAGVIIVEQEAIADERGFFARTWCRREFEKQGLNSDLSQCSVSFNAVKGTLRGMHWQDAPHEEVKLVRCTRGAIYDVALDMRPYSQTYKQWTAVELSARNGKALYIPEGCAHGFLTLEDESEVFYQIAGEYCGAAARGVRYDDAAFKIVWPIPPEMIGERDLAWLNFKS